MIYVATYHNGDRVELEYMKTVNADNDNDAITRLLDPEYFLLKVTRNDVTILEKI